MFTNSYLDLDFFSNLKYFKCIQDKPTKSSNIVNVSKNHPDILGLRTSNDLKIDLTGQGNHTAQISIPELNDGISSNRSSGLIYSLPAVAKKGEIKTTSMNLNVTLNILDTGFHAHDQEGFKKINAIVLVCDATNPNSLDHMLFKFSLDVILCKLWPLHTILSS